jgi:hypothetical protein
MSASMTNEYYADATADAAGVAAPAVAEQYAKPALAELIATKFVGLGGHVIFFPCGTKRCTTPGWEQRATNDLNTALAWARQDPYANIGLVGKQDGLWALDVDDLSLITELQTVAKQHGGIGTYTTATVSGGVHLIFRQNAASRTMGNISVKGDKNKETMSARVDDRYVVLAGSWAHPFNDESIPLKQYTVYDADAPAIEAPQWLLDWVVSKDVKATGSKIKEPFKAAADGGVSDGGRNNYLASFVGKMHQSFNWDFEKMLRETLDENERKCVPPLSNSEVESVVRSIAGYERVPEMVLNQQPDPVQPVQFLMDEDPTWKYAIPREEYEVQMDAEYPVLPLKPAFGPTWDDSIMHGIAGDIVRKAAEYCEAHPAGMYLDLLVSLGNLIGRGPYFNVGATRHYANEFMARVGESSKSRKGTGRDAVNEVLKLVDPTWYQERVASGFGSAEAIVHSIRDDSQQAVRSRKKNIYETVSVPGIADKRLMIREGELASIFQLAGKKESRADVVLRLGWDSSPLQNLVKGKTDGISNSASCQFPHISISADTTRDEFMRKLPSGADANGFGNRFLYCYVERVKMCPHGGPQLDWTPELQTLNEALRFARDLSYVGMQNASRQLWARMYDEIDAEQQSMYGLAAAMTARGAAHVRRLALILCLLDNHDCIETQHLRAAKRIWDYCVDSARYIFGGVTLDQTRILDWIKQQPGPVTVSQIRETMFQRHRKADWIRDPAP